jgi:hypothetical protein
MLRRLEVGVVLFELQFRGRENDMNLRMFVTCRGNHLRAMPTVAPAVQHSTAPALSLGQSSLFDWWYTITVLIRVYFTTVNSGQYY